MRESRCPHPERPYTLTAEAKRAAAKDSSKAPWIISVQGGSLLGNIECASAVGPGLRMATAFA